MPPSSGIAWGVGILKERAATYKDGSTKTPKLTLSYLIKSENFVELQIQDVWDTSQGSPAQRIFAISLR